MIGSIYARRGFNRKTATLVYKEGWVLTMEIEA